MTFALKSGSSFYEFPIPPQKFSFTPTPKTAFQKTIGGSVTQYLGSFASIQAQGLINTTNTLDKAGRTAEACLLAQFIKTAHLNQKQGLTSYFTYSDKAFEDTPVTIGNFSLNQNLETVAFTYSIEMQINSQSALNKLGSMNSAFAELKSEIGFSDPGGGFHGGSSATSTTALKYQALTGFPGVAQAQSASSQPAPAGNGKGSKVMTPAQAKSYAYSQLKNYGLNPSQFEDLVKLWTRESSWNMHAENQSSGAYGIPQADPDGGQGIANSASYRNNAMVQIQWGLKYIKDRYGSLANAWAHEVSDGWY